MDNPFFVFTFEAVLFCFSPYGRRSWVGLNMEITGAHRVFFLHLECVCVCVCIEAVVMMVVGFFLDLVYELLLRVIILYSIRVYIYTNTNTYVI